MKKTLIIASLLGLIGVILGAFGAHGLKPHLSPEQLLSYETGVRYQLIHAVALLAILGFRSHCSDKLMRISTGFMTTGVVLFSGSIYLLACREVIGLTSYKWLGPITPLGGLCLIIAWGILVVAGIRMPSKAP
jgi:uncharacterized membrane protein YgdD (TMEM256/DUF423 family)